jgi:predicted nucleic acid-binding Zn ribbon protein
MEGAKCMDKVISSHHCKYCNKPLTSLNQMHERHCGSEECQNKQEEESKREWTYWENYWDD